MTTELQPTPETDDAMVRPVAGGFHFVPLHLARKLERERDEARRERDEISERFDLLAAAYQSLVVIKIQRDEMRAELGKLKGEGEV